MKIDAEDFRRHYASLSDEALLEMDTSDLVDLARRCYDEEVSRRGLDLTAEDAETEAEPFDDEGDDGERFAASDFDSGDKPDWLEHAECVCSLSANPGQHPAPLLETAREVLGAAGIPCYIGVPTDEETGQPMLVYELKVPSAVYLEAVGLLDKEIFNPELEATWRTHFEMLSDKDLRAIKPKALIAGLLDRAERLTKAYNEELARRKSS